MVTWVSDSTTSENKISEIARVQFYAEYLTPKSGFSDEYSPHHVWFDSVECKSKYSNAMESDEVMKTEFAGRGSGTWWCPDIDNFLIQNDPELYRYGPGVNLVMVVNECSVARQIAVDNDFTTFDCPLDSTDAQEEILKMEVWVKSMTKNAQNYTYY